MENVEYVVDYYFISACLSRPKTFGWYTSNYLHKFEISSNLHEQEVEICIYVFLVYGMDIFTLEVVKYRCPTRTKEKQ